MRAKPAAARKETIWPDGTACFSSELQSECVRLQICSSTARTKGPGNDFIFGRAQSSARLFIWRAQLPPLYPAPSFSLLRKKLYFSWN